MTGFPFLLLILLYSTLQCWKHICYYSVGERICWPVFPPIAIRFGLIPVRWPRLFLYCYCNNVPFGSSITLPLTLLCSPYPQPCHVVIPVILALLLPFNCCWRQPYATDVFYSQALQCLLAVPLLARRILRRFLRPISFLWWQRYSPLVFDAYCVFTWHWKRTDDDARTVVLPTRPGVAVTGHLMPCH